MKTLLSIPISLLLLVAPCFGQMSAVPNGTILQRLGFGGAIITNTIGCYTMGINYTLAENFEGATGSGYDVEGWSKFGGGTVDPYYSTAPFQGSYSCEIVYNASATGITNNHATLSGDTDYFFGLKWVRFPSSTTGFFQIGNGTNYLARLSVATTGTIRVEQGAATKTTTGAMATNTWYWVYMKYQTNGTASVGFSTNGTRTLSGSNWTNVTGGASVLAPNNVMLRANLSARPIFDRVLIKDIANQADIGDNP